MKALCFAAHGEPADVLTLQDLPSPPLGPGQVRVRMRLAPVNPSDVGYIRGRYGKSPSRFPAVPGFEGVGEVIESRGLIGRYLRGRRVSVLAEGQGTWAEEVVVDARRAIPVPSSIPDEQAAAYFINPATAFLLARRVHVLSPGAWLLQTGANSQVGRMVVRLGRHFGFRTVNVVRRPDAAEELRGLGAEACVVHDAAVNTEEELRGSLREVTGGQPIQAAIDCIGGELGSRILRGLGEGGRMVVFGTMSDAPLEVPSRVLMTADRTLSGFWLGPWMARQSLPGKLGIIRELGKLHRAGLFSSVIAGVSTLSQFREAFEARPHDGKLLIRTSP